MPVRFSIQCSSMPRRSAIGRLLTTCLGQVVAEAEHRGGAGGWRRRGGPPRRGVRYALAVSLVMRRAIFDSTVPGPVSTKSSAPASSRARKVSRQRTGRMSASASSPRDVGERRGGGAAVDGEAGVAELDLVQRLAERRDGRLHAGRVERAGDVERAGADVVLAGGLLGLLERAALAGQDDLAGGVVVGDGDAGGLGDRLGVLDRAAQQGEHRAGVVGLGHQLAAQHDELEGVVRARARRRRSARRSRRASGRRPSSARRRKRASRPSRRRRSRAGRSAWIRRRGRTGPPRRARCSDRADRAAPARRLRACRGSGSPGRETAGQCRFAWSSVPTLSGCYRASPSIGALAPPGQGGYAPRGGGWQASRPCRACDP